MNLSKTVVTLALGGFLALGLAAAPAARDQARPQGQAEKAVKAVSIDDVRSVLGAARDDLSGVADFSQGDNGEVVIAYRYYDADQANFEIDFANEIAPRIQSLYKAIKGLDRLRFQVVVPGSSGAPMWAPFADFQMDRKTIEELHWTGFVARYILEQVLQDRK
jgi:hypothetical protein